ncbi:MAG: ribosome-associated translation inhibitor RaiA [Candidatus Acetothermia bacterium]|nr:ribosome-associated translation inhibitor RaiA [Candidatus Acetothermia bacterium]MDH7505563.1 ribosome-associated translation inhibitor RaiA [Candidatus Acetothermia bacterium]
MKITIAGRHVEVTDTLRSYILSKVEGLERFHDGIISVDINLGLEKNRNTVDMVAHLVRRKVAKVSEESNDMYTSIDLAVDKLKRQLRRHKSRIKEHRGEIREVEGPGEDRRGRRVELIRREVALPKPMTPEEALVELGSLEQDFLIFIDAETGGLKVLHRREDGVAELLEPQY